MAFTYSATINDANDAIPGLISQAVTTATTPLSNRAQTLRTEIDALKARVVALESGSTTPAPAPAYTPNNSGGSGANPGNYRNLAFTSATPNFGSISSQYHLDTAHVDWTKPVGALFHLHGDGAQEFTSPDSTTVNAYRQVAIDNNFIFVLPKTPDTTGTATWWEEDSAAEFLIDLWGYVTKVRHNIDLNRIYWSGYSGGAEVLTYDILSNYTGRWTGGGAQMLGGGGALASTPNVVPSATFLSHFPMKWVVGALDDGSTSTDGFNAIAAADKGKLEYANAGFTTSKVTIPGEDHYQSENNGPGELRSFITATLWK